MNVILNLNCCLKCGKIYGIGSIFTTSFAEKSKWHIFNFRIVPGHFKFIITFIWMEVLILVKIELMIQMKRDFICNFRENKKIIFNFWLLLFYFEGELQLESQVLYSLLHLSHTQLFVKPTRKTLLIKKGRILEKLNALH